MSEASKPTYLVDAYSDPVVVRIDGRACFQNSACLRDFVTELVGQGKTRFVFDFLHCTSMDSTFLGVLAGAAPGAVVYDMCGVLGAQAGTDIVLRRFGQGGSSAV